MITFTDTMETGKGFRGSLPAKLFAKWKQRHPVRILPDAKLADMRIDVSNRGNFTVCQLRERGFAGTYQQVGVGFAKRRPDDKFVWSIGFNIAVWRALEDAYGVPM